MKPKKSSTRSAVGLVMPTPRLAPSNVLISLETLEHMRQCEAREWMSRYEKKAIERGSASAQSWWQGVKNDIAKRRGQPACDDLVQRMQNERTSRRARLPASGAVPEPSQGHPLGQAVQDSIRLPRGKHVVGKAPDQGVEAPWWTD